MSLNFACVFCKRRFSYHSYICLLTGDLCDGTECHNGGTCSVVNEEKVCDCPEFTSGLFCEYLVAFYSEWSAFGECAGPCGPTVMRTRTRNCTDISNNLREDCENQLVLAEKEVKV